VTLNPDQNRQALASIQAWRDGGMTGGAPTCPVCGKDTLTVEDRSARPHAEWYHLACTACGLDETLNVPLGATGLGDIN
jgi:predicted RNA-binding Zn-ribbon protein involved in translation (DUF1610 family)